MLLLLAHFSASKSSCKVQHFYWWINGRGPLDKKCFLDCWEGEGRGGLFGKYKNEIISQTNRFNTESILVGQFN